MGTITRQGNLITLKNSNGSELQCNTMYGGIALSLKKNYTSTNVISPVAGAGEGFQAVYDFGTDPTAGSANGPMAYNISVRNTSPIYSYYAKEIIAANIGNEAYYGVSGIAPCFWTAADITENTHIVNPQNPDPIGNWCLKYHNLLNFPPTFYDSVECPIVYCNSAIENLGVMLLGDEIKQNTNPAYEAVYSHLPWSEKITYIPNSATTYRGNISLKEAGPTSWAGFVFRKDLTGITPQWTRDNVLNAPGYHFTVGREGNCSLRQQPGNTAIWEASTSLQKLIAKTIITDLGTKFELRTVKEDGRFVDIFVDNQWVGSAKLDVYEKSAFGYVAQVFKGWAKFSYRELFDINSTFTSVYNTCPDGSFEGEITYDCSSSATKFLSPMYRMNNPVGFLNHTLKEGVQAWRPDNQKYSEATLRAVLDAHGGTLTTDQAKACYTGKNDDSEGLFLVMKSRDVIGADGNKWPYLGHWFLDSLNVAISPIKYDNNFDATKIRRATIKLKFGAEVNTAWL